MRPAKTKPKGLTSVLRDMVDYRPEICRIQVMDVNAPDLSPAHLKKYLRPRLHVSVFILKKAKWSLNLLVSYVCFNTWGGIKRVLLRGHRALMHFPQKFCPLFV